MDPSELYLAFVIGSLVVGLVAFIVLGHFTPRATVLIIGLVLFALSWSIDYNMIRELRMLKGISRLLGFVGIFLGLFYFLRNRKRTPVAVAKVVGDQPKLADSETTAKASGTVSIIRRILAYVVFVLAALGFIVACTQVFISGPNRPPTDSPRFVGYVVGSFLVPLVLTIVGLLLYGSKKR